MDASGYIFKSFFTENTKVTTAFKIAGMHDY